MGMNRRKRYQRRKLPGECIEIAKKFLRPYMKLSAYHMDSVYNESDGRAAVTLDNMPLLCYSGIAEKKSPQFQKKENVMKILHASKSVVNREVCDK